MNRYRVRSLIALASGLLLLVACLAIPVVALASAADSCHGAPLPHSRCDGASGSSGPSILALPADPFRLPELRTSGTVGRHAIGSAPTHSVYGPFTPRAPPLS